MIPETCFPNSNGRPWVGRPDVREHPSPCFRCVKHELNKRTRSFLRGAQCRTPSHDGCQCRTRRRAPLHGLKITRICLRSRTHTPRTHAYPEWRPPRLAWREKGRPARPPLPPPPRFLAAGAAAFLCRPCGVLIGGKMQANDAIKAKTNAPCVLSCPCNDALEHARSFFNNCAAKKI